MSLTIVRGANNAQLWDRCVDQFLAGSPGPGPTGHSDWIWLSHRNLRDRMFDTAHDRGHEGWLGPPITFFGDWAKLFDIRDNSVGLLTRRRILADCATSLGGELQALSTTQSGAVVRNHMLDPLLADLLPEGVLPDQLREALGQLQGDEFSQTRNRWIVAVYEDYLAELARRDRTDWRSVNALLADRIEAGRLPDVLRGAQRLHIYGITSARTRRRLLTALARQTDVDVRLYLMREPEIEPFFDDLTDIVEELPSLNSDEQDAVASETSSTHVQPAPDAMREMAWVARSIKQLIVDGVAEPQDIAVVARSGRSDTRLVIRALRHAGVPASGRIRSSLTEVAAIKALLLVFRGATRQWDYQSLRAVLDHPYFDTKVDLRGIDFIAGAYRPAGLDAWHEMLEATLRRVQQNDRETWNKGLFEDQLEKDVQAFDRVRETLRCLNDPRPEAAWIDLTLGFLNENRGLFLLRRRLCDPVGDRWDIVRLDQHGVLQLEQLLHEWRELDLDDRPIDPVAWYAMLRRMLEGSELVLATPGQKGVQVLEAHDAGLVPFSHTFVVHANDGEFPLTGSSSGVLSDEERERLNDLGIPLDHRETALRRERSLWRAVTGQAGQVHVSYRSTDPSGKPLLPSLMIGGPNHELLDELPRLYRPTGEETVTPEDSDQEAAFLLANRLVSANSAEPSRIQIAPSDPNKLQQAIIAAVAESHRGPGLARIVDSTGHPALRPNPWNGELRDSDVISFLEDKFDDEYTWSAGQLQTYARVPFQFFLERVLRLTIREEAEDETTLLTFGNVAHEILEKFYREHLGTLPNALISTCEDRLEDIAAAVFQEREAGGDWLGVPILWSTTRQKILEAVRGYVAWELPYLHEKGETPVLVEHRFGFDGEPALLSGSDVVGRTTSLRLRGKIDRVDRTGPVDDPVLHVLDFKSGNTPFGPDYEDGTILQGALYLEVLDLEGHRVKYGRYRSIKKAGATPNAARIAYGSEKYNAALSIALSIPERARAGLFEPVASRRGGWADWDVPLEIRRTEAQVEHGNRFEPPAVEGGN